MQLISPEYKELNRQLHQEQSRYGIGGGTRFAEDIDQWLSNIPGVNSVLDYGCGKGVLKKYLKRFKGTIQEYDPAIPGKDIEPMSADIVICVEVLEHVEPEYLDNVLEHIRGLARKGVYMTVALTEGKRKLPDGRLAHINVRSSRFWREKLHSVFCGDGNTGSFEVAGTRGNKMIFRVVY